MPFTDNNGVNIFYEIEGEGAPLVIHHGLGGDIDSWRAQGYVKPLSEKYRLILLNVRGHGRSDKFYDPEAYLMKNLVSDITSVLDDLGIDKAHFFGYSLGGRVGMAILKYAPERFSSMILGGYGMQESDSEEEIERQKPMIELSMKGYEAVIEYAEGIKGAKFPEEELTYFRTMDFEALANIRKVQEHLGLAKVLPFVTIPTLFYCGDLDHSFESAKQCAELIPNASFVALTGINHGTGFDRSDLVLPHVFEFLDKQPVK